MNNPSNSSHIFLGNSDESIRTAVLEEVSNLNIKVEKYLDLGCSDGTVTCQIAEKVNAIEIYGVDVNVEGIKIANSRDLKTYQVDLNKEPLPFKDNSFDLITAIEVIEHIINNDNLLEESYRCLRHGGYLLITTPNLASWLNRIELLLGYVPGMYELSFKYNIGRPINNMKPIIPSGHIRIYTFKALQDHLKIYGYKIYRKKGKGLSTSKGLIKLMDSFFSFIHAYSLLSELLIIAKKE